MLLRYHFIGAIFAISVCPAWAAQSDQEIQQLTKEVAELKDKLKMLETNATRTENRLKATTSVLVDVINNLASAVDISGKLIKPELMEHPEIVSTQVAVLERRFREKFAMLQRQINEIKQRHP
jgi:hypothetical protein